MQIINVQQHHHHTHVAHNNFYSPELIHLLKQFFAAAEQRHEKLKRLIHGLQTCNSETGKSLVSELSTYSEETELDIEIVKKLLPLNGAD